MPTAATSDGVTLHYEEVGRGAPIVFVHEFADDWRGWDGQLKFFGRRYRAIAFNARGYPPSDVPQDFERYSQTRAAEDIRDVLDRLGLARAHVVGLSMGGYATLHFGLMFSDRALSLTVGGAGYGSGTERATFHKDTDYVAAQFDKGMAAVAEFYTRGPTRVQFAAKDPLGYRAFYERFASGSALGHANTLRGVQRRRPSVFELEDRLVRLEVPTLIITGDEDEPCLEPAIFMKRKIPASGLVVLPKSGHAINLEEPELFNRAVLDFITAVEAGAWPRRDPASQTG
ncbi:MAG TPA: alpha/beta hydrolase, partial [Methylomirabilota bacterium]|nr:alpha/beta hydrolase [Methylomirabilota bacterium]